MNICNFLWLFVSVTAFIGYYNDNPGPRYLICSCTRPRYIVNSSTYFSPVATHYYIIPCAVCVAYFSFSFDDILISSTQVGGYT